MNIRPAEPKDITSLMALAAHAATAAEWKREDYKKLFKPAGALRRHAFVLEEDSRVSAFIVARELGSEWEIENIAVAGPARRRGLGTRLLGVVLSLAQSRGASYVFLEVRASNQAAQALYQKWAFEKAGRRKAYYDNPAEDALLYRLAFPAPVL